MSESKTQEQAQEVPSDQDGLSGHEPGSLNATPVRRASGLGEVVERRRVVRAVRADTGGHANVESGQQNVAPKTIVVIDDELDQVDLAVLLLQSAGHRAIGSTDGAQAVAMVTAEGADSVVLDFMLNGMTGADVCEALRSEPKTRHVRIVVVSGTPEREIRRSCTLYDAYLKKPASSSALFEALQ